MRLASSMSGRLSKSRVRRGLYLMILFSRGWEDSRVERRTDRLPDGRSVVLRRFLSFLSSMDLMWSIVSLYCWSPSWRNALRVHSPVGRSTLLIALYPC